MKLTLISVLCCLLCNSLAISQENEQFPVPQEQAIALVGSPLLTGIPFLDGDKWFIPTIKGLYTIGQYNIIDRQDFIYNTPPKTKGSYYVPVQFCPQVPPGDWKNTKNCGQTSAMMGACKLLHLAPGQDFITDSNRWLAWRYNEKKFLQANGWYTNTRQLATLIREYWRLQAVDLKYATENVLTNELRKGKPVIVAVRLNMSTSSSTLGHFMLLTGYDGRYVWLNDPGRSQVSQGKDRRFSLSQFRGSWATQNRSCVTFSFSSNSNQSSQQ